MIRAFYSGLFAQSGGASRRNKVLIRGTVSTAILVILLWWLPTESLLLAIVSVPFKTWLLVIAGYIAGHLVSAYKWRLLLGAVDVLISGREAIRAHAAGLFTNMCLPSIVGGDVVRAGLIVRDHKRIENVALGSLADRISDTFALLLIAAVAGLLLPASEEIDAAYILSRLALVLSGGVIAGFVIVRLVPISRLSQKLQDIVLRIRVALDLLAGAPGTALLAFLMSVGIQGWFILLNILLAEQIGIEASASLWFFAWPLAKLIAMAPISLGGIGVREAAIAGLMSPFGIK
ncbi:MAG TPA: lysylphosphatidylglycerol synthase transmembrane domain-containing protein, partial [Gammaproteobacteria bacterium]|nr:lysylphosphatidylglycerol synthase transmembrane domain-containing protein [Gammaproteobacteria bacterium]